jgi:hypothetical protein
MLHQHEDVSHLYTAEAAEAITNRQFKATASHAAKAFPGHRRMRDTMMMLHPTHIPFP